MGRRNKIIITILIICLTILVISFNIPLDKEIIPVRFTLGERTGFDLSPNELSFGKIEVNQSATRNIMVENKFKTPIKIYIKSSGEISKNIIVSENNFILNIQESKNITFSIYTKGLTEFREYNGEIEIISKKA